MKAVVMAGGEGTRLRPLTSNQPKPMVPIVGKPCMEHILDLLRHHEIDEVVVTLAFMPQAIRAYFGDGESLGHATSTTRSRSSRSARPARCASREQRTRRHVPRHLGRRALRRRPRRRSSPRTARRARRSRSGSSRSTTRSSSASSSRDEEGRVERFLEKPSWGQVFSDTINTGIYVLEPEVLRHVPGDRPFDFSKELFPLLLEMGRPIYGYVLDGYWQDIGNLDQFRQANFDALDGRVQPRRPRHPACAATSGSSEDVDIDASRASRAPLSSGDTAASRDGASIGPYSVLSQRRDRARGRAHRAERRRRRHVHRPERDRRGGDPGQRLRPPRPRPRARGRRDRRPGARSAPRRASYPGRADLPVQGDRDRCADPRERRLGDAGGDHAVRPRRRDRARQRRPHTRDGHAPRRRRSARRSIAATRIVASRETSKPRAACSSAPCWPAWPRPGVHVVDLRISPACGPDAPRS